MNIVRLTPPKHPFNTEITIPGSKSYTLRALLLAALTPGAVILHQPLFSDDTEAMLSCLKALGIETEIGTESIKITGDITQVQDTDYELNANLSAATLRFLLALSCLLPGRQTLQGHVGLNRRPVGDLVESLKALGAEIRYLDQPGYPPVSVLSSKLDTSRPIRLSGKTSSQYVSALLMIAPLMGETHIEIIDDLISKPYVAMTLDIMQAFGVSVENNHFKGFTISAWQHYQCREYRIEADASSAGYFLGLAALTQSRLTLTNLPPESKQADMELLEILEKMGNKICRENGRITIEGIGIRPMTLNMENCPDQAQTVSVLAAFANGKTRIEGLQSLRVKETDRIEATRCELEKMGIRVEVEADAMTIHGGNPKAARIVTYGDHRMAMAFAMAGAILPGMEIEDPAVVNKTFPTFWDCLSGVGLGVEKIQSDKIILTGFMGSGKSSVGRLLAERLQLEFIETDQQIEQQTWQSIPEIFETRGEAAFRNLERELAATLQNCAQTVISTGGGMGAFEPVMAVLSDGGTVVYLETSLEGALARIQNNGHRPLLKDPAQVENLYETRKPLYARFAHIIVSTDGKTPEQVADEIAALLKERP